MRDKLPFQDNEFDLVFANLSIHYFSDEDTRKLMLKIKKNFFETIAITNFETDNRVLLCKVFFAYVPC